MLYGSTIKGYVDRRRLKDEVLLFRPSMSYPFAISECIIRQIIKQAYCMATFDLQDVLLLLLKLIVI